MNFKLAGKAEEVFRRLEEMTDMEMVTGNVIYEGIRDFENKIKVSRLEIFPCDIGGMPGIQKKSYTPLDPAPSRELYNHSREFEWGYSGSGPAQLALALVLDATGDKVLALKHHQDFKERFVAGWGYYWCINADQIKRWVELKENHLKITGGQ